MLQTSELPTHHPEIFLQGAPPVEVKCSPGLSCPVYSSQHLSVLFFLCFSFFYSKLVPDMSWAFCKFLGNGEIYQGYQMEKTTRVGGVRHEKASPSGKAGSMSGSGWEDKAEKGFGTRSSGAS